MILSSLKNTAFRRLGLCAVLSGTALTTEAASVSFGDAQELHSTTRDVHPLPSRQEMKREARRFTRDLRQNELIVWFLQSDSEDENFVLIEELDDEGEMRRTLLEIPHPDHIDGGIPLQELAVFEQVPAPSPFAGLLYDTLNLPEDLKVGVGSLEFERKNLRFKAALRLPKKEDRSRGESFFDEEGFRSELLLKEFSLNFEF